jgi:hypothetical protein
MKQKTESVKYKLFMAGEGLLAVFSRLRYALFAVALAMLFAIFMFGIINSNFYWPLYMSRLPVIDKSVLFGDMAVKLLASFFSTFEGALLMVVSLLQGAAFATMTYTMRRNKRFDTAAVGGGTIAMVAAALGLGCVPCGTSLIMPIITLLFSSSAYAAANLASVAVLVVAFALSLYSLYRLGYIAYSHNELDKHENKGERR